MPFQLQDSLAPKGRQTVVRHVPGADLVLPVPGEGHHPHPVPGQNFDAVQPAGQGGAVLHREDGGRFPLAPGRLDIGGGAARQDFSGKRLHLPLKTAPVEVVIGDGLLPFQPVGDEDGAALAPGYLLGNGGQGEVPPGQVQGVQLLDLVHQSGGCLLPPERVPEGGQPGGVLRGQSGEGVAVQVDESAGEHGNHSFSVILCTGFTVSSWSGRCVSFSRPPPRPKR